MKRVLITGGAGFIGSHLADELLACGCEVRALDSLVARVHGPGRQRPAYLDPRVELIVGDVRDRAAVGLALDGCGAVAHLAALSRNGESMAQPAQYVSTNLLGTAVLLEAVAGLSPRPRVAVASSMSIYGNASPAAECRPPAPASVYGITKWTQERLCLLAGSSVALRLFNVYGPWQCEGVIPTFAAALAAGQRPVIHGDGLQLRDFVHVRDVARAFRLAIETPDAAGLVFNVGTGTGATIAAVARFLAQRMGRPDLPPHITGQCLPGDVQHCAADTTAARELLGFTAEVSLADGLADLAVRVSLPVCLTR